MRHWIAMLALTAGTVGCEKTQRLAVARCGPMAARVQQEAPVDATYTVQMRHGSSDTFDSIETASVHVRPGTVLGFERTENAVQAFAGDVRFDLPAASDADLKWYAKRKKPTKFAEAPRAAVFLLR